MTPDRLLTTAILPALADLDARGIPDSFDARRLLLAIALQESALVYRRQVVDGEQKGPAASWWQFERQGGCRGVLAHRATRDHMRTLCQLYGVAPTEQGLWEGMRYQDIVGAAAARLLVYTLPQRLPATAAEGWAQYMEAWRPGKPHPQKWQDCWKTATAAASELEVPA